jgi:Domain of unknown function (DUF5666)/Domain of unknown function (DUF5667)
MNKRLPDALENCLQRMDQGESLDSALALYPELAAQLRPLLETAARARSARRESLPQAVLVRQRSRGLALAAELRQGKNRRLLQRRFWRPAVTILAVIAILVMSSNGLLIASAHSIPGDTLYPLKRSLESTQLHLVSNPAKRQVLEREFGERRVDETKSLLTHQRIENVDFTGVVSSQSEGKWLVSGISVNVTPHTEIDEGILVGDEIEVHGTTDSGGSVAASQLSLVKKTAPNPEHPEASPTPTPSPESSVESAPTETLDESSVVPSHSGEDASQSSESKDQSPAKSGENHSSGETTYTPHSDSGHGGD